MGRSALSNGVAFVSEPWLEKADTFKFSQDDSLAEWHAALPWRNVTRNRLDISEADAVFRLSAGSRCALPVSATQVRLLSTKSRTIFAFHRVDLPMKNYRISDSMSILMSSDGVYSGWSMRNFLRFVEFDMMGQKPYGDFCQPSEFKEDEIEYQALYFILTNYCDEVIDKLGNDGEAVSRMELIARNEQWPFRSKIFRFTLAGLKDFYL
jgi:hypothetical protein